MDVDFIFMKRRGGRIVRNVAIVATSASLIFVFFRLSQAGSLTPPAAPASTFNTVGQIYAALASNSFDSAGVTASRSGSALQISKCIATFITGGSCP